MNTYTVATARKNFSRIVNMVAKTGDSVLVTRYGKPIVKIIPASKERKIKE